LEIGSQDVFAQAGLEPQFSDLCLPSSWDYRCGPLAPSKMTLYYITPIILAIQEAEIRRIAVSSQPGQIVCKTLSRKYLTQKKGLME
jgi:hypothetical protein